MRCFIVATTVIICRTILYVNGFTTSPLPIIGEGGIAFLFAIGVIWRYGFL